MTKRVVVPDSVYRAANDIAEEKEMTIKEAVRHAFIEAGYDA